MNYEDLMESIIETLWNKGPEFATEQKPNEQMKQPTKASIEKREDYAFT